MPGAIRSTCTARSHRPDHQTDAAAVDQARSDPDHGRSDRKYLAHDQGHTRNRRCNRTLLPSIRDLQRTSMDSLFLIGTDSRRRRSSGSLRLRAIVTSDIETLAEFTLANKDRQTLRKTITEPGMKNKCLDSLNGTYRFASRDFIASQVNTETVQLPASSWHDFI